MTTLQVTISDQLAADAARAGLLTPQALGDMLHERLRARAVANLQELWRRTDAEEISDQHLNEITAEVKAARRAG